MNLRLVYSHSLVFFQLDIEFLVYKVSKVKGPNTSYKMDNNGLQHLQMNCETESWKHFNQHVQFIFSGPYKETSVEKDSVRSRPC